MTYIQNNKLQRCLRGVTSIIVTDDQIKRTKGDTKS